MYIYMYIQMYSVQQFKTRFEQQCENCLAQVHCGAVTSPGAALLNGRLSNASMRQLSGQLRRKEG